jgi:phosphatidylglycerol---prolipoprotein diacylglyceryl transferase
VYSAPVSPALSLAAWFHDLSPFAIRFTETFGIRWYGLSYALGFLIGWLVLRWLAKVGFTPIPRARIGDVILIWVVGVIVGGRLGYVLVYQPALLWKFEPGFPWWQVLALNQGGMASHGGVLGVIIASFLVARGFRDEQGVRRGRVPVRHVLDLSALAVPFGLLLGRLANFVNGELLGAVVARPGDPAPRWAVRFPQEVLEHPVQTEAQLDAIRRIAQTVGSPGRSFDANYRLVLDRIQRGDQALVQQLEPLISARHPSQLYQALAEGVIVGIVLWLIARRPRLPGVIGAWFFISYGILRVITEIWRLPDSHLAVQRIMGLSRGQWLSVAMVVAGVTALVVVKRIGGERMGGWGTMRRQIQG